MLADQLDTVFPDLAKVRDQRLRRLVADQWAYLGERGPHHTDIRKIPVHPSLPIEKYGNLVSHIRGQMTIAPAVVEAMGREWSVKLDLDHFLVCAAVHDSAKVIEFVLKDGQLVATPGFDHAIEGAKVARHVGFPREVVHMIAAHTYLGPKRLPRTAAAQLFSFLDPICLPVFPEAGKGAVERHLELNGWTPAPWPEEI